MASGIRLTFYSTKTSQWNFSWSDLPFLLKGMTAHYILFFMESFFYRIVLLVYLTVIIISTPIFFGVSGHWGWLPLQPDAAEYHVYMEQANIWPPLDSNWETQDHCIEKRLALGKTSVSPLAKLSSNVELTDRGARDPKGPTSSY